MVPGKQHKLHAPLLPLVALIKVIQWNFLSECSYERIVCYIKHPCIFFAELCSITKRTVVDKIV